MNTFFLKLLPGILFLATGSLAPGQESRPVDSDRIVLEPVQGVMTVKAVVPRLEDEQFHLAIPETIGSREAILLNWVETNDRIQWEGPDEEGAVSTEWSPGGRILYRLRLVPGVDTVDIEMDVQNQTDWVWHDVYSFNCVNPEEEYFDDPTLTHTFLSVDGEPMPVADAKGTSHHMGAYLLEGHTPQRGYMQGQLAAENKKSDDTWMASVAEDKGYVMATATADSVFLFNNRELACIHSAVDFGTIGPDETSSTVGRVYLMKGDLNDFLSRYEKEKEALKALQDLAEED